MGYGIISRGELEATTVDGVSLNAIYREFQQTLSMWNATRDPFIRLFTFDTTQAGEAIDVDGDRIGFEVASEFGVPRAGSVKAEPFIIGYGFKDYDRATRFTRQYLRDAQRDKIDAVHSAVLEGHNERLFTEAMRALMTKTTVSTRKRNREGIEIFDLYDGEADSLPPVYGGVTFSAGHTHYLTTNSTTLDGTDLKDMTRHITQHGFGTAPNEKVVIFVNPAQADTVRGFRVTGGEPFDFIPSSSAAPYLTDLRVAGAEPPAQFQGLDVIGSYGKALVVEHVLVPSGYVIALATSGPGSRRNPLGFRQHPNKGEQGLRLIPGPTQYPLVESYYTFAGGFGVRNRGAACVMQIVNSTTYTSPVFSDRY